MLSISVNSIINQCMIALVMWPFCPVLFSQTPHYINYTIDDGLASNETYSIIEDRKGNLWIGTDQGISVYNGYEFRNISAKDGLTDNTVFGFFEDYKGRIWLRTLSGNLTYIEDNKVNQVLEESFGYIISLYVDEKDTIWFSTNTKQFKAYPGPDNVYSFEELENFYAIRKIDNSKNGLITGNYTTTRQNQYYLGGEEHLFHQSYWTNDWISYSRLQAYNVSESEILASIGPFIISVSADTTYVIKKVGDKPIILDMVCDSLITMANHSGVLLADRNGNKVMPFLPGVDVTSVISDREGGYWISTHANGIFYCPNIAVKNFHLEPTSRIWGIARNRDSVLVAFGYFGEIFKKTETDFVKTYSQDKGSYNEFMFYSFNEDGDLVENFHEFAVNTRNNEKTNFGFHGRKFELSSNQYIITTGSDLSLFDSESDSCLFEMDHPWRLSHYLEFQDADTMYIPTVGGLYRYDFINGMVCLGDVYPPLKRRVNVCKIDRQRRIWIGTNEMGIFLLDQGKLISINQFNSAIGDICRNLEIGENNVWASTENQLVKISLDNYTKTNTYSTEDGIMSNGIRCIYPEGPYIYLGHDDGITKFPVNYQKKDVKPLIEIGQIQINNTTQKNNPNYILKYTERDLKVSFTGISLGSELTYKYRLKQNENEAVWKYTGNREVEFLSVPPGKYAFEVVAINSVGLESEVPAKITFSIAKPFWKLWWFYLSCVVVGLIIIYLFIRYRFVKIKREITQQKRLAEIEQRALRSRMNPHFIFNSLNSIQSFILRDDKRNANRYLSEFSKLMRAILEDSDKKLIPINRELETLKAYINAELLRVKSKFDFEIRVAEGIDTSRYKMPPLLLQPYVENAIWHGIMNKDGQGYLKIELRELKFGLLFIIEDNGVGREKALEIKSKRKVRHQSAGLEITGNRVGLLKELYGGEFSINLVDLKDDQIALGTRVEIQIPYLNTTKNL